jgi:putative membrane protein
MSKWKLSVLPTVALTLACSASGPQADSPNNNAGDPARVAVKEARDRETTTGADATTTTDTEVRDFVVTMATHGIAEVDLGRLAAQRASNSEVKRFGQDMVTDHGRSGADLKTLAAHLGITVPTQADEAHRMLADQLSQVSGRGFDQAYMNAMVTGHQETLLTAFGGERMILTGGGGKQPGGQATAAGPPQDSNPFQNGPRKRYRLFKPTSRALAIFRVKWHALVRHRHSSSTMARTWKPLTNERSSFYPGPQSRQPRNSRS